jgi:predicted metal-binding protein
VDSSPSLSNDEPTRVHVCTTCRGEGEPSLPMEDRAGARLFRSLSVAAGDDRGIELVPVECLSVCKRPCTVSFSAPGKWTYIYGDLPPESAAPIILDAVKLYAAAPEGLIPWKLRVDAIKKGVVARLPPHPAIPTPKADPA